MRARNDCVLSDYLSMKGENVHIPFSEDDTNDQEVILLGQGSMQSGRDRMRYWAAEERAARRAQGGMNNRTRRNAKRWK